MKQIKLQESLRKKFTKLGVKMVAPETVFFSKDTKIGKNVFIEPYVVIGQKVKINREIQIFLIYTPLISVMAWAFLGNGQAERFGLLSLSIMLPIFMMLVVSKFKKKKLILSMIVGFVILPMLTFYSIMLI